MPFVLTLLRVLIMNGCGFLSNASYASIEMIKCFFSFILLMWCIILIDFHLNDEKGFSLEEKVQTHLVKT